MKKMGLSFVLTMLVVLMVPGFITFFFSAPGDYNITEPLAGTVGVKAHTDDTTAEKIQVFSPETENLDDTIDFEEYICGVVAAEMPVEYEHEALKAQAVAARTYAYKRLLSTDGGPIKGITPKEIDAIYQAYLSPFRLKEIWGNDFEENYSKIREAVLATKGQIITYNDEPVEAVFHSSSAGMTENAENVWNKEYPYLKSVPSEGDEEISEKRFNKDELMSLINNNFSEINLNSGDFLSQFQITKRTDAGYVLEVRVGSQILTGKQMRELLSLKSSAFSVSEENGEVIFITRGYGHGVGMSQDGANRMALNGFDYREILEHYYKGINISTIS